MHTWLVIWKLADFFIIFFLNIIELCHLPLLSNFCSYNKWSYWWHVKSMSFLVIFWEMSMWVIVATFSGYVLQNMYSLLCYKTKYIFWKSAFSPDENKSTNYCLPFIRSVIYFQGFSFVNSLSSSIQNNSCFILPTTSVIFHSFGDFPNEYFEQTRMSVEIVESSFLSW